MKSILVAVDKVDLFWPFVADDISKCLTDTNADCCAADLYIMCRQGAAFLHLITDEEKIKAVMVWRAETWPSAIVLKNLVTVGKGMTRWLPVAIQSANELARLCGATKFRWQGRPEWARVFRKAKVTAVSYEMDVE